MTKPLLFREAVAKISLPKLPGPKPDAKRTAPAGAPRIKGDGDGDGIPYEKDRKKGGGAPSKKEVADALDLWRGGGYADINGYLRGQRPASAAAAMEEAHGVALDVQRAVAALDAHIAAAAPLAKPLTVYRGIGGAQARALAAKIGSKATIRDPGFMAVSGSESIAGSGEIVGGGDALVVRMTLPAGTRAARITQGDNPADLAQDEWLLPRGGALRIGKLRKLTRGNSGTLTEMDVEWVPPKAPVAKALTFDEVMKAKLPKLPKLPRPKLAPGIQAGRFDPSQHPRNPDGTFADKPGAGNDAPRGAAFDPKRAAVFGKDRPLPKSLYGVPFAPWADAPTDLAGWAKVKGQRPKLKEPPLPKLGPGMKLGSGVIIREPDGRIWLTKPTNGFGGYDHTFPKGTAEEGLSLQANAIKEAFEETGLRVEITGFAGDVQRTTSVGRYYYARRVGGSPAAHGWESEAIVLAPPEQLHHYLNMPLDQKMAHELAGAPPPPPKPEAPSASFGEGLMAPQYGIGKPGEAKAKAKTFGAAWGGKQAAPAPAGAKPKPKVWGGSIYGGEEQPTPKLFDDIFDALGWKKPGVKKAAGEDAPRLFDDIHVPLGTPLPFAAALATIEKAVKLPGHIKALLRPKGGVTAPGSAVGANFGAKAGGKISGNLCRGPGGKFVPCGIGGGPVHSVNTAKLAASQNKEAQKTAKLIGEWEKMHAAGDLDGILATKPGAGAFLPGAGGYSKMKAAAWTAMHDDIMAQKAGKLVAAMKDAPVPTKAWKKTGGQLGSNPGGQFMDEAGVQHYVKFSKSDLHARNEAVAAKLYELAGTPVVPVKLADVADLSGGTAKLGIASTWATKSKFEPGNAAHNALAAEDFATHAWLSNWDAVGTGFDNLALVNGKMTTVDVGGSLLFRAQGTPKGAAFGKSVVEWDTMRAAATPGDAPKVFGGMTAEQLHASAKKVAAIPDDAIRGVVKAHGPGTPAEREALAELLVQRKADIVARAEKLGLGPVAAGADALPTPAAVAKPQPPHPVAPPGPDITPKAAQAAAPAGGAPAAAGGALDDAAIATALGADAAMMQAALGNKKYAAMIAAAKKGDIAGVQAVQFTSKGGKSDQAALITAMEAKAPKAALAADPAGMDELANFKLNPAAPAKAALPAEASAAVVAPPALPAKPPVSAISSATNPVSKSKQAALDGVEKAAADYAAGKLDGQAALDALGKIKLGVGTYWKPIAKYQAGTMAAISAHAGAAKAAKEAAEAAQAAAAKAAQAAPKAAPQIAGAMTADEVKAFALKEMPSKGPLEGGTWLPGQKADVEALARAAAKGPDAVEAIATKSLVGDGIKTKLVAQMKAAAPAAPPPAAIAAATAAAAGAPAAAAAAAKALPVPKGIKGKGSDVSNAWAAAKADVGNPGAGAFANANKLWSAAYAGDIKTFVATDATDLFSITFKQKIAHKIGAPKPLTATEFGDAMAAAKAKTGGPTAAKLAAIEEAAKKGDVGAMAALDTGLDGPVKTDWGAVKLKAVALGAMLPPQAKLSVSAAKAVAMKTKAAWGAPLPGWKAAAKADEAGLLAAAKGGPAALAAYSTTSGFGLKLQADLLDEMAAPYAALKGTTAPGGMAAVISTASPTSGAGAIPTPVIPLVQQPPKVPPAAGAKAKPTLDPAKLTPPPSFLNWGGSGKAGPSSKAAINEANEKATQAIWALAQKGDAAGIKALKLDVIDPGTGAVKGSATFDQHPSQHVKGYASSVLSEIEYQLNPPKLYSLRDTPDIGALAAKHPAISIADAAKAEKVGKFAVLARYKPEEVQTMGADLFADGVKETLKNGKLTMTTYSAAAAEGYAKMPKTAQQAIKAHTGSSYGHTNAELWAGNESGAIAAARSAVVTHGHYVKPGTILSRHIQLSDADMKAMEKAVGSVLFASEQSSSSIDPSMWVKNVQLKLKVGPGVKAMWLSDPNKPISVQGSGEKEMFIPSGMRILVQAVRKGGADADGFGASGQKMVVEALVLPNDTL